MNELLCEMCGSNDVVKQDGLFICQSCGTKYSVEEARKIMAGETVEIEGTVRIDSSKELENLYEIARRAKDSDNSENALNYYDKILIKDPNSWEAQFYVVYYRAMSCKIIEIQSAAISVTNSLSPVLNLVKENVPSEEIEDIVSEISVRCDIIANLFKEVSYNHYMNIDYEFRGQYVQEYVDRVFAAMNILYILGDLLEDMFNGKYSTISSNLWKDAIELHKSVMYHLTDQLTNQDHIREYGQKIKKVDPDYEIPYEPKNNSPVEGGKPLPTKSGGCYVATCVYGSYDCPEVWTLRRFRDTKLKQSIVGRTFIKCYYATSPTIVKYFGEYNLFNSIFKPILDNIVNKLQNEGIDSTMYIDE